MDRDSLRAAIDRAQRERCAALGYPTCAECGGDFSEGRYTEGCQGCMARKAGRKKREDADYRARQAAGRKERHVRAAA